MDHLREKAESSKVELRELTAWKVVKENKLDLTKKLLDKLEAQAEALEKVLKDKEDKISKSKKQLRLAKEDAIKEYCDSNAFLSELGGSFADFFDDCLCQVKAFFPDLDPSHISIDTQG